MTIFNAPYSVRCAQMVEQRAWYLVVMDFFNGAYVWHSFIRLKAYLAEAKRSDRGSIVSLAESLKSSAGMQHQDLEVVDSAGEICSESQDSRWAPRRSRRLLSPEKQVGRKNSKP